MIGEILPAAVLVEDTREDLLDCVLFAEEQVVVGRAVEKRRREFTTARACARRALARLELPPQPIVAGEHGEPLWPAGVVGSITHCQGYRACALARASDFLAIGIDAEPNQALPAGVLGDIACAEEERAWLREQQRLAPEICWDRLLFSAKESVYKAWFPLAGRRLGFEDAVLTVDPRAKSFHARLLVSGPLVRGPALTRGSPAPALTSRIPGPASTGDGQRLTTMHGRWLVRDGLIVTAIALPA